MRRRTKWLLGGALGIALAGYAFAQTVVTLNLTGNESVLCQIGGVGGTSCVTTVYALRNGTGYQLQTTGGTVNTNIPNTTSKLIATTSITTWNVGLPSSPFDGQMVEIACPGGTATTVSVAATGQTIAGTAFTSCSAGGAAANTAEWIFSLSNTTWQRIQ